MAAPRKRWVAAWRAGRLVWPALWSRWAAFAQSTEIRKAPAAERAAGTVRDQEIRRQAPDQPKPGAAPADWSVEVTERAVTATRSEISGNEQLTRFSLAFSSVVPYQVFTLPNPHRIVIDMPDVGFRLPPAEGQQGRA